jgi:acetyl esterase/lipase
MTDTSHLGPPPSFDPELVPVLESLAQVMPPAILPGMIPALREFMAATAPTDDELRRGGAIDFTERRIPGPQGAPEVSLLICRPAGSTGPGPTVYFTHGGGLILGDNRNLIGEMLDWVQDLGVVLVSVEYRLAPEHPFPAGLEDVHAGLRWTVEHAEELDVDPRRLVVSGPSAGGGLTAALALLVRDLDGPVLAGQLLVCPMLDDRNDSPSARQMARGTAPRTTRAGRQRSARGAAARTSRPTRRPRAPRTSPVCPRSSSTSVPPKRSATRSSPTPRASGRPGVRRSCTCGPVASTASTRSPRTPSCRSGRARPGLRGYGGRCTSDRLHHRRLLT